MYVYKYIPLKVSRRQINVCVLLARARVGLRVRFVAHGLLNANRNCVRAPASTLKARVSPLCSVVQLYLFCEVPFFQQRDTRLEWCSTSAAAPGCDGGRVC